MASFDPVMAIDRERVSIFEQWVVRHNLTAPLCDARNVRPGGALLAHPLL